MLDILLYISIRSSSAKHSLKLLGHLHSPVILLLRYFTGVQQLLDLLFGVSLKRLPKLLESLKQIALLSLPLYLIVQWIHGGILLFSRFVV